MNVHQKLYHLQSEHMIDEHQVHGVDVLPSLLAVVDGYKSSAGCPFEHVLYGKGLHR